MKCYSNFSIFPWKNKFVLVVSLERRRFFSFYFISFDIRDEFGCRIVGEPCACNDDGLSWWAGRESSHEWTGPVSCPSRHTQNKKRGVAMVCVTCLFVCFSLCVCPVFYRDICHSDDRMDVYFIFNSFFYFLILFGVFFCFHQHPKKWQIFFFKFYARSFRNLFFWVEILDFRSDSFEI